MLKNKGPLKKKPLKKPPSSNIRKRTPAKKRKVRFGSTVAAAAAEVPAAADVPAAAVVSTFVAAEQYYYITRFLTILAALSLIGHIFLFNDKINAAKIALGIVFFCVHGALAYGVFRVSFTQAYYVNVLLAAWVVGTFLTIVVPLFLYPMFEKGDDSSATDDSQTTN